MKVLSNDDLDEIEDLYNRLDCGLGAEEPTP